jgi:RNA polymerase sigma-70 factor (ECF subfamily)
VDDSTRAELERKARELCARGDHAGAATLAVKGYGPEIFGFLVTMCSSEADASDVFSETSEGLWRSLPTFAWECSLRTWAYAIARNIMRSRARSAARRRRRGVAVGDSSLEQLAQAVRTETLAFLRTEKRTRLQALRDSLPEDDRMLLVLRVDKKLAWNDLARVLAESESEGQETVSLSDAAVAKEAARLRKQFQLVKDRLRALAKKEGLID